MAFLRTHPFSVVWAGVLLALPVSAQTVTPDTTAPWKYYPLAVGDVREYEGVENIFGDPYYVRERVVGETVALGHRYFQIEYASTYGTGSERMLDPVRFDTASATIRVLDRGAEIVMNGGCPFDLAFGSKVTCGDEVQHWVEGSHDGWFPIGDGADLDTVRTAVKTFHNWAGFSTSYASGIGPIGSGGEGTHQWLRYARVGGVEYGVQAFPSALAEGPGRSLSVRLGPSLASHRAMLVVNARPSGPARVEVVDLLGRRVLALDRPLSAGRQSVPLDVSGLAPGAYVVRVAAGGEVGTARLTVVR